MSIAKICDHCFKGIENNRNQVHIDYYDDKKRWIGKDYHIDCFNYKFSCDINKIKEGEKD